MTTKKWGEISPTIFEKGAGKQLALIDTRFIRVTWQVFLPGSRIKYHSHDSEWEIVLGLKWLFVAAYVPKMEHCLFGPPRKDKRWSILSIKIGKKP